MYIKILYERETKNIQAPVEVQEAILSIAKNLDKYYGSERTEDEDGGFILFATTPEEIKSLCELELDITTSVLEYAEPIPTNEGIFINSLFLINNEFSVSVITPLSITPSNILGELH